MPENETNGTNGKWKKFLSWFYPCTSKERKFRIPIEERLSQVYSIQDNDLLAIIINNQAFNSDQRITVQGDLGERYWGSRDFNYIVPTDSNITEALSKKVRNEKNQTAAAIRIKYAVKEKGLEEIIKNTSFFEWLSNKNEAGYSVIRDVSSFYIVMIEGLPMDKAFKDPSPDKRNAYVRALLEFVDDFYFKKEHIIEKPESGQAQYSIECWREALLRLARNLPAEIRDTCISDVRDAAGSIISILKESTPVTYTAPDAKLSNFIYVSEVGPIEPGFIAMSDRGFKEDVFSEVKRNALDAEHYQKKNFDRFLGLPFMDLGCLYESMTRDPEFKDIVPVVKGAIDRFLDTGEWRAPDREVNDIKKQWGPWDPTLARAAYDFGRLYSIISLEVKSANLRQDREKLLKSIKEYSPNP